MQIKWEHHTEDYTKAKKKHVNHLWYISLIDETDIDFGVEAEIDRIDNGPFEVIFYKGEINRTPERVKAKTFKTLTAAKKAAKAWMLKGLQRYVNKMQQIMLTVHDLKCDE